MAKKRKESKIGWVSKKWWMKYLHNQITESNPLHIPEIHRYKEYENVRKVRITIEVL